MGKIGKSVLSTPGIVRRDSGYDPFSKSWLLTTTDDENLKKAKEGLKRQGFRKTYQYSDARGIQCYVYKKGNIRVVLIPV